MCGIAGFATNRTEGLSPDMLRIARDGLAHRGPDDFGFFCMRGGDRRLTRDVREFLPGTRRLLVHRRLSILDLSAAGWQPMATDDGRYLLTFNGEIYNYVELRGELEKQGYHFVSQSDTEVLLKGYVAWGPEVLDRLIGMFAFAILDTQNEELFLARDFFGIKPLYYATTADCFGFASDLGVLTEAMGLPRRPDPENLYLFMRFGITDHGNRTLFEAVRQLPSAHWLNVNLRTMSQSGPVRYWRPDLERSRDVSYDQATASVREIFLENIRLHMRSDVPIGVALSGGLDSSAILMSMRHVAGRTQRLIAFSFVPDDPKLSEEKWIDLVSAASGAEVHKVHVSPSDIVAEFEDLTATHCLPTGSSSVLAQRFVFRRAQELGIKVMLDGQGGDELFAGYQHFLGAPLASYLQCGNVVRAWNYLRDACRLNRVSRSFLLALAADNMLPACLRGCVRRIGHREFVPGWMDADWFRARGVAGGPARPGYRREALRNQLLAHVEGAGLAHLLRYEDRNSMAFSIESRVPFLTPTLASYALALPQSYLISPKGETKAVFRSAMRGIVPDEVISRHDKIGFEPPERAWLGHLNKWVCDSLASDYAASMRPLRAKAAAIEWKNVLRGRRRFDSRVWRWMSVLNWGQHFGIDFT